ncbi:MAG: Ig-like domain-containing protein, partial [Oscillospiraceae bacterium]|jgi:hypothetical protein|nr:Ig-like domain-containing protein [Oscillospiraceae bacterium]
VAGVEEKDLRYDACLQSNGGAFATITEQKNNGNGKIKIKGLQATDSLTLAVLVRNGTNQTLTINFAVKPKQVKVTGVTVKPTSKFLFGGQSFTIAPTISPSNATNKNVTWSIGNTSVATVDSKGKVTAKNKAGTAKITCKTKDQGKTAVCTVTVSVGKSRTLGTQNSSLWTSGYTPDEWADYYARLGWQYPLQNTSNTRISASSHDPSYPSYGYSVMLNGIRKRYKVGDHGRARRSVRTSPFGNHRPSIAKYRHRKWRLFRRGAVAVQAPERHEDRCRVCAAEIPWADSTDNG